MVDGTGLYYQFIASSEEGEVTITNMTYHINENDGSNPFTMITMYDAYIGLQHNMLVKGKKDVEFINLNLVVPEGDNGRFYGASPTYSGIGRNGVSSGKTISSITLTSVTYVDRDGHKKILHRNLKSPDRMSTYSTMWVNHPYYLNYLNGLALGQNMIFQQEFYSVGGDHLVKEIPLKIKAVDCSMGTIPKISIGSFEEGSIYPIIITPATVTRLNDSIFIVKLPNSLMKKEKNTVVSFYGEVESMTITPDTKLKVALGDLKYLKYIEVATGVEFSTQNERFLWAGHNYWPQYPENYYWELRP